MSIEIHIHTEKGPNLSPSPPWGRGWPAPGALFRRGGRGVGVPGKLAIVNISVGQHTRCAPPVPKDPRRDRERDRGKDRGAPWTRSPRYMILTGRLQGKRRAAAGAVLIWIVTPASDRPWSRHDGGATTEFGQDPAAAAGCGLWATPEGCAACFAQAKRRRFVARG